MKTLHVYQAPGLGITLTCDDEDYHWLKALFERNCKPFKALMDMGFVLKSKEKADEDEID